MRSLLRTVWLASAGLFALVVVAPRAADAGGLYLYEIGTPDVGLASAGWAARAQDASTLFKNPGGMNRLEGNQLQVGAQALYANIPGFTASAGTNVSGNSGGNPINVLPAASGFYVHRVDEDISVGFGLFSNFGLAEKFNGEWVGRYYAKDAALVGLSLMPAISFRFTDWLSIGAAVNTMIGYMKTTVAVNNIADKLGDGQLQIKDTTVGIGGNVGILIEPIKGTRLGITYYSPVRLNFSDTPKFTGLGPGLSAALRATGVLGSQLDLGMTVPQHLMVSAYHDLTDRLAVMADFGWENWKQFGQVEVSVSDPNATSLTTAIPYQDTYHAAFGGQYRLSPQWLINAGFAYDSSMVKDQNRQLILPVGTTYRYGIGSQYQVTPALQVGLSYELAYTGNLPVDQNRGPLAGHVVGQYPDTFLNFFAANVSYRF